MNPQPQPYQQQPVAAIEKPPMQMQPAGSRVYETPAWVTAVRGFAVVLGIAIMAMGGYLIHGVLLDAWAFALATGLFTVIIVAYELVSEKVQGARGLYNVFAVMGLDALMVIFWLSSMGANAHTRASFRYSVNVAGCYDDGSSIDSTTCVVYKRDTAAVAGSVGLAVMSAIAGLSALEMLLFGATLFYVVTAYRQGCADAAPTTNVEAGAFLPAATAPTQYAPQPQPTPIQPQPTPVQPQPTPIQPQYTGQQFTPVSTPSPLPQYTGQQMYQQPAPQQQYPANELPVQQPQAYSPAVSPVHQGMYSPPTQPYQPPQELPHR